MLHDKPSESSQHQLHRSVRLVCVSDTHNASPLDGAFKLPDGDVLVHAGDLTNQGSLAELQRTISWLEAAPHQVKVVIAGNHDITLDRPFYEAHGQTFHNQHLQNIADCRNLLTGSQSITYLEHGSAIVDLCETDETHPATRFKVFGSPYSPVATHGRRAWAFGYADHEADSIWSAIPDDADIVVTHTPPRDLCDHSSSNSTPHRDPAGCASLRDALWRVRPRLLCCGHVHEGRGAAFVQWDPADAGDSALVRQWKDPSSGTKRLSRINLTSRPTVPIIGQAWSMEPAMNVSSKRIAAGPHHETCVINAAIMAQSWPHKGQHNKPIVLDMLLPALAPTEA